MKKRLIVIAYREWVFRKDEKVLLPIMEALMTKKDIIHADHPEIRFAKRMLPGALTLHYYSPIDSKRYIPELIINDIANDFPNFDDILVLLHNGVGGTNDLSFLNVPADKITHERLQVEYFSGGNGIVYDKLLSAAGTIFPQIRNTTEDSVRIPLEEIWEYFKTKATTFRDNFIRRL